jgi:site-specific DNA-methyltransferase (adenine-specific)
MRILVFALICTGVQHPVRMGGKEVLKVSTIELIQGDCLEKMKDIPDGSIDMVLTDPPYGTTACKWDSIIPLEPMWEQLKRAIKPNGAIVMTASQPFTTTLIASNMKMFKYEWIWEKNRGSNFATVKYQPMKEHENVLVFCQGKTVYNQIKEERAEGGKSRAYYQINASNTGKRDAFGSIVGIDSGFIDKNFRCPRSIQKFNTEVGLHPTQKPVALMEYLIKTYTNQGETVLDFAMGSGTTGVACKNLNRNFIGIELDQKYFKIAETRINGNI